MNTKYEKLISELREMIKKNTGNIKSTDFSKILILISRLTELMDLQQQELESLRNQLNLKPAHETTFDSFQLELLEYMYTNQSIDEIKLNEFSKKNQQYRIAFTKLKDEYIYKRFGNIYNNSPNYHIKPDKEKYIVGELSKLGKI